jgi:hypothetical protein
MDCAEVVIRCVFSVNVAFMDHGSGYMNEPPPQGLSDMGFLQTTIYTVVGEWYIYCIYKQTSEMYSK